jgi:hypothetical protein
MKFVTWLWGDRNWHSSYGPEHVNLLCDCIRRKYKGNAEFYCVTDNPEGLGDDITIIPLWPDFSELGHCYRRLKAFSKEFGELIGGKFCSIDLDVVITGDLTEIIDNAPDFAIMKDFQPPTPYNGSFFIMEPGARVQVWEEFVKDPHGLIAKGDKLGYCACDQKIIATVLGKGERVLGDSDGFYSYKFAIKQRGNKLPENAKVIAFHGTGKPWHKEYRAIDWVRKNCRYTKRAIVLGGASGVWDELKALGNVAENAAIIAINDSGYAYSGKIDYWVTLHPEKFAGWRQKRIYNGYNMDFVSVGHNSTNIKPENMDKGMNEYVNGKLWHGSSGLFAVKVAFEQGFDDVILCGVPMNGDVNIHRGESWKQFNDFRNGWEEALPELKGRVYSQSGWTRELLGKFM